MVLKLSSAPGWGVAAVAATHQVDHSLVPITSSIIWYRSTGGSVAGKITIHLESYKPFVIDFGKFGGLLIYGLKAW